jgi:hypothetical protein
MSRPVPYSEERDGKGAVKRVYWPKGDAMDKRRAMRGQMEAALAKQGKNYRLADKKKMLDERWGEYCETRRSLDER